MKPTPPVVLTSAQTRLGLRFSNWEAAASTVHTTLVTGTFLTGFALAWGANDFQLAVFGAVPFLAAPFQWLGAYLVDQRAEWRREIVAFCCLLARASWVLVALIPCLFSEPPRQVVTWILLLFFIQQLSGNMQSPGWMAWMAVLLPRKLQGRYMGVRGRMTESVSIVSALAAGAIIDYFRAQAMERHGFALLQFIAAAAGVCSFLLLRRQPDPGHRAPPGKVGSRSLFGPLADRRFRWLVAFNVCWLAGLNICTPFLTAHLIKNMHWDFRHLSWLAVLASVAAILVNPIWGRLADRHGHKPVLKVCWLGLLTVPVFYVVCPLNLHWPIYVANVANGIFLSGFSLTMFSLSLKGLPAEARTMGAAALSAVTGPATFLSLLASGALRHVCHGRIHDGRQWMVLLPSIEGLYSRRRFQWALRLGSGRGAPARPRWTSCSGNQARDPTGSQILPS